MRFPTVFAALLSIVLLASICAAQPAAPFLWTWSPNTGDIEAQYSIATPYVIPVIQSANQLAGIDVAAGKQRWALKTANLSACPLQDGCYFYPTQVAYDNSSDLLFVAIGAQNASTLSVIAITSATGAVVYNISVPIAVDLEAGWNPFGFYLATAPSLLYVWDSYLGSLHAYTIATGAVAWTVNATNATMCTDAISDIAGLEVGPHGVAIAYCGLYAYWAWDSQGHEIWSNLGLPNTSDIWFYAPAFLSDGSFLIWREGVPESPCHYNVTATAYALTWCAASPALPFGWSGGAYVLPPGASIAITMISNEAGASTDGTFGLGAFSTQDGALQWTQTAIAEYTWQDSVAWAPVADPIDGTIYFAPGEQLSSFIAPLLVISPINGTVLTTYTLPDPTTAVLFATANTVYLASKTALYALKPTA